MMCLIRLGEPYDTDLVITMNIPDKITDEDVVVNGQNQKPGQSYAYTKFVKQTEAEFK